MGRLLASPSVLADSDDVFQLYGIERNLAFASKFLLGRLFLDFVGGSEDGFNCIIVAGFTIEVPGDLGLIASYWHWEVFLPWLAVLFLAAPESNVTHEERLFDIRWQFGCIPFASFDGFADGGVSALSAAVATPQSRTERTAV